LRTKRLPARIRFFAIIAVATCLAVASGPAWAASKKADRSDQYPNSIMTDEGGAPPPKVKRPVRRGSSSPSPVPPYQSPLTPLGRAPGVIEPPQAGRTLPSSQPVPGTPGSLPPPPPSLSGGTFQDKAVVCVHHGSSVGVGAGQIGAYTQGCVNTR
jgi:hypothetical protein